MVKLLSVVVRKDRIVAVVKLEGSASAYTTPELMKRILQEFPDLPSHACVNAKGPTFAHVMNYTSIPHVIEHIVIDLQATEFTRRMAEGSGAVVSDPPLLKGVTKWTDESNGVAQIQVSMFDDLVALRALKAAIDYVNTLV